MPLPAVTSPPRTPTVSTSRNHINTPVCRVGAVHSIISGRGGAALSGDVHFTPNLSEKRNVNRGDECLNACD